MDVKVKSYIEVEYDDLDRAVSQAFGQSYEFVANEEANNYSSYPFNDIDGAPITSEYDQRKLDTFKETGRGTFLARILLNEMCRLELIAPGDYLVKVFW